MQKQVFQRAKMANSAFLTHNLVFGLHISLLLSLVNCAARPEEGQFLQLKMLLSF